MLHLPAANGASPRSIHRSKWYGASRVGRKFLEAMVCHTPDGMLRRSCQCDFSTDGVTATRSYLPGGEIREAYFVPDYLPAVLWRQSGSAVPLEVEPYFDLRLYRDRSHDQPYFTELVDGAVVIKREVAMPAGDTAEGIDSGGVPVPVHETLWAVCIAGGGGAVNLTVPGSRWRPMWYSLDAARRRYLKQLALQETPVVEHAPLWELTSAWMYAPCRVSTSPGASIAIGFGSSREEAWTAAHTTINSSDRLEEEKRDRLAGLLSHSWFSTGHQPTDTAYGHVLSRVVDCLTVVGANPETNSSDQAAAILAGDAYFQEAWKRDENIALGGLMATGHYDIARRVIRSTWQSQDTHTGRLPLRLRTGEAPGYTSSDATLWALFRLAQFVQLTGDDSTLKAALPMAATFFRISLVQSRHGLLPSGGLSVPEHQWETWMDTEFSSRAGYPIEIQYLWLRALLAFVPILAPVDPELAAAMTTAASDLLKSLDLFSRGGYPADHLSFELEPEDLLTPNAYFWTVLGLDFDWSWEDHLLALGRWELGGISGIRTLARSQWERVLGSQVSALARSGRPLPSIGKANYHRGLEWNWLSQLFVAGELKHGRPDMAYDHYLARQIHDAGAHAGIGGVSEVFDHRGPAGPDFQAWSMTSLLESLQRFTGVSIDFPQNCITIMPLKPRRWPYIHARKWYGRFPLDVAYASSPGLQELELTFPNGAPTAVRLVIGLPLRHTHLSHPPTVWHEGHESIVQEWKLNEQPCRVEFELVASPSQVIRLRS